MNREKCKYYEKGRCSGTKNCIECAPYNCPLPVYPEHLPETESHAKSSVNVINGVSPDAPVIVNESGGKQSHTPYAFHMLPLSAVFGAAEVCGYGAKKYGETLNNRNYVKIPTEDHINHAIQHLYAYLAGDKQDDHLGHAIVRCMFAYDVSKREGTA